MQGVQSLNPISAMSNLNDPLKIEVVDLLEGESSTHTKTQSDKTVNTVKSPSVVTMTLSSSSSDMSEEETTEPARPIDSLKPNKSIQDQINTPVNQVDKNVQGERAQLMNTIVQMFSKCAELPLLDGKEDITDMEAAKRLRNVDKIMSKMHDLLMQRSGLYGRRDAPFMDPDEPMTHADATRYALSDKPDEDVRRFVKMQEASVWFVEEIDLAADKFEDLDKNTQFFLEMVLAFFAASDGIVADNICKNVQSAFTVPEVASFFACQNFMENIHSETYGLLLQTYVRDDKRRRELREAIHTLPCVKNKAEWALHWARPHHTLAERLVAYTCVEGIHFSGSFCAIFYLKSKGLMPGLTFSNELISRDEGMHCEFGCLLHNKLQNPCSQEVAHEIIKSAVEVELDFVTSALPVRLLGMNADLMCCYIKMCANRLAIALNFEPIYDKNEAYNPFDWMELISLQGKTNFFEKRVGEYQRAGVMNSLKDEENMRTFAIDEDF